jgi:hypothetical protein
MLTIVDGGAHAQNPGTNQSCPSGRGCSVGHYNVTVCDQSYKTSTT